MKYESERQSCMSAMMASDLRNLKDRFFNDHHYRSQVDLLMGAWQVNASLIKKTFIPYPP